MKNLFEVTSAAEITQRIARLRPDSARQWGSMTAAQMLAHCSGWMSLAAGATTSPRTLAGRIFGPIAKRVLLSEQPIRRNMPTDPLLVVRDDKDFAAEQRRLIDWVERFSVGGPAQCTTHPHGFFGPMAPIEWATLGYKHLDHHLRQFGS
jgi:hypothetical protein